jgi:hypothetical protein
MFKVSAAAFALIVLIAVPGSVSAAGQNRDGIRNIDRIEVSSARRHSKRSAQRVAYVPRRPTDEEPWVGLRTDLAGNSYVYFRTGVGTPFGPGTSLRQSVR